MLIVDDDAAVRGVLRESLSRAYEVAEAADGPAALEQIEAARFDVVLCDLEMPGMDGLQTIERLHGAHPGLPIIVITAHGTPENAAAAARLGVVDFLQKPAPIADLLFSVGMAVERRALLERLDLFERGRAFGPAADADALYDRVVRLAIEVLRADDASLMLLEEDRRLRIARSASLPDAVRAATRVALGERVAGRVALLDEPVLILDDVSGDTRFAGVPPLRPVRAAIVCPLALPAGPVGVLSVNRLRGGKLFDERDREHAALFASLVAPAVGNFRLQSHLQDRLERLAAAQEEVIVSEKMIALQGLLGGVAHELNNPLCSILGYARLLQRSDLEARVRKGVDVVLREADRAARVVGDLLSLARRSPPETRRIALNDVVAAALERTARDLAVCRIDVRADLAPDPLPVRGDFEQLVTAVVNVIVNARQAMYDLRRRGTLALRTEARGGRAVITVADDGPGIPREHVRRVFDPFFTTRPTGRGTGLGLSIAFAIARDHGGSIRVDGAAARGASFAIEVPIDPAEPGRARAGDARAAC